MRYSREEQVEWDFPPPVFSNLLRDYSAFLSFFLSITASETIKGTLLDCRWILLFLKRNPPLVHLCFSVQHLGASIQSSAMSAVAFQRYESQFVVLHLQITDLLICLHSFCYYKTCKWEEIFHCFSCWVSYHLPTLLGLSNMPSMDTRPVLRIILSETLYASCLQ